MKRGILTFSSERTAFELTASKQSKEKDKTINKLTRHKRNEWTCRGAVLICRRSEWCRQSGQSAISLRQDAALQPVTGQIRPVSLTKALLTECIISFLRASSVVPKRGACRPIRCRRPLNGVAIASPLLAIWRQFAVQCRALSCRLNRLLFNLGCVGHILISQ